MLDRCERENLYNLHAMFNDPQARERDFYARAVPVVVIDLLAINRQWLHGMSQEQLAGYEAAMRARPMLRIACIADGGLLDGAHRIETLLREGRTAMLAADFTGLIDSRSAGTMFPVRIVSRPDAEPGLSM